MPEEVYIDPENIPDSVYELGEQGQKGTRMKKIKIDYSQIRRIDMRNLCSTTLDAVKRFYDDPKNLEAFEAWKKERIAKENV